jgi:GR25 family glycosyltransferase involved in LPS biosynthesis
MKAYVINLDSRIDRWQSVLNQANQLGLEIERISAVSTLEVETKIETFVTTGVSATWKSHQKAMQAFLQSRDAYALILEDDFKVDCDLNAIIAHTSRLDSFDFVQLGYLKTSIRDLLDLRIANFQDIGLKILCRFLSIIQQHNILNSKLRLREQMAVPFSFVRNDIRAGGQAYLVSHNFALASQFMNQPAFLSADGVFISLGDVRSFKMFRSRKSQVNQTDSPSSVQQRYL